jgi:hypothetical protein
MAEKKRERDPYYVRKEREILATYGGLLVLWLLFMGTLFYVLVIL